MIRIVISDENAEHTQGIIDAINVGYGSNISANVLAIAGWAAAVNYVKNNNPVKILLRCDTGIASYITAAQEVYPRVQTICPLGSNSFVQLNTFENEEPPVIIPVGAGDSEGQNNTGFGHGLEFWLQDTSNVHPEDESSYSAGRLAGILLKLMDMLNCTAWEARFRLRQTANQNEPNRETWSWDLRNGYGLPNLNFAAAYKGFIPEDPYNVSEQPNEVYQGIIFEQDTDYGVSKIAKIDSVTLSNNRQYEFNIGHYLDENSVNKKPLKVSVEKFLSDKLNNVLYKTLSEEVQKFNNKEFLK